MALMEFIFQGLHFLPILLDTFSPLTPPRVPVLLVSSLSTPLVHLVGKGIIWYGCWIGSGRDSATSPSQSQFQIPEPEPKKQASRARLWYGK
jgi:hypothetical protein